MKISISKIIFSGIILFAPFTTLSSQKNQYIFNDDKSEVTLAIDLKKASHTINNVMRKRLGQPLLEARIYPMNINMDTIGFWTESSTKNENIWKLKVEVPLSKGFYISLDDFYLPQGTQLYAYNKDNFQNAVVFNHEDNPKGGPYSIENLTGDNVVLEYIADKQITEKPKIHISDIGYKYSDETGNVSGFGQSQSCMININCQQGASWQTQKKGVVRLRIRKTTDGVNSGAACSGTLINNTNNDRTPYILTAYHCLENVDSTNPDNFSIFFDYEMPTCEKTGISPPYKFHRGANVKVLNPTIGGSDGVLLQLTEAIPEDWNVYFNGWDRSNNTNEITNGAIIHHPEGDVKKITLYNKKPVSGTWDASSPVNSYWILSYSEGATQGGSSGAPLFNQNGLIIGSLTGGYNSCSSPSQSDYYGKFWYHWDQSSDVSMHMSRFLDPSNTGQITLAGLNNNDNLPKELVLDKSNVSVLVNTTATITILSGNEGYTITSSDNNVVQADVTGNTISVKAKNRGYAELTVTDQKGKSKTITVYVRGNIDISVKDYNILIAIYNEDANNKDEITQVRIIDLDANVLYNKKNISEEEHTIDMTPFKNNIYIIQVKTKNGTVKAEKILWQK